MTYHVEIEASAARDLVRVARGDKVAARRIDTTIQALKENPRPPSATKLVSSDMWRVRVGDYRVVYLIQDHVRVVTVTKIGHRKNVYEG